MDVMEGFVFNHTRKGKIDKTLLLCLAIFIFKASGVAVPLGASTACQ